MLQWHIGEQNSSTDGLARGHGGALHKICGTFIQKKPVYNGPSVAVRPFICALVALFLYNLKWLSSSLFYQTSLILHRTDVF